MKESAKREMRELREHLNKVFKLVKSMKKDGKDVEGGRCMRSSDSRLNFSEKDRGKVWKRGMEVSVEMVAVSVEIRIGVMDGMKWAPSVVVPIFKGREDAMSCRAYRGVKLLEHAIKIVEKVL